MEMIHSSYLKEQNGAKPWNAAKALDFQRYSSMGEQQQYLQDNKQRIKSKSSLMNGILK